MERFKKVGCPGGDSGQIYTLRASSFILPTEENSTKEATAQTYFFAFSPNQEHKALSRERRIMSSGPQHVVVRFFVALVKYIYGGSQK
jgi:hypothetical protein